MELYSSVNILNRGMPYENKDVPPLQLDDENSLALQLLQTPRLRYL